MLDYQDDIINLITLYEKIGKISFRNKQISNSEFKSHVAFIKKKYNILDKSMPNIVFDYYNPMIKNECSVCGKITKFSSTTGAYKKFCSTACGSKASKVRPKQSIAMLKLINDPIKGIEYKNKLKVASKIFLDSTAGEEYKQKASVRLTNKIINGEWTPNITNTWTHWDVNIDGKKFRSSFEGIFYLYNKLIDNIVFYEKLRIPYYDTQLKKNRIYIVDFIDYKNKTAFEIKPSSLVDDTNTKDKLSALYKWCSDNDYTFKIITENEIKQFYNEITNNEITRYVSNEFLISFGDKYKWK